MTFGRARRAGVERIWPADAAAAEQLATALLEAHIVAARAATAAAAEIGAPAIGVGFDLRVGCPRQQQSADTDRRNQRRQRLCPRGCPTRAPSGPAPDESRIRHRHLPDCSS